MPRYSPRTGLLSTYQTGPFDSTHLYVQWGGGLPGGESWSCGFRMWKSGGSAEADGAACLVPVSAAIAAFHGRAASLIGTQAKLSFVKVNAISTAGTYLGSGTNEATYADDPGGGFPSTHPNQICLVASTTTGFSRGPAHRGRFYLPLPSITVGSDGRITDANAVQVDGSLATLLTDVNANGTGHVMTVMSRKAGAPGHRAVTGFEVGSVLDTQRRRRRSLVEVYQ